MKTDRKKRTAAGSFINYYSQISIWNVPGTLVHETKPIVMLANVQCPHPITTDQKDLILISKEYGNDWCLTHSLNGSYHIIEASLPDVYDQALTHLPDLIIVRFNRGEEFIAELCRKLKHNVHTDCIPFLVLTERDEVLTKITLLNSGVDDYFVMPCYPEELKARMHNLIEKRRKIKKYNGGVVLQTFVNNVVSEEDRFLQRVNKVIQENLNNRQFDVEMFAREVCVSNTQLYRKLLAVTGQSPNNYVRDVRLKHAAYLLEKRVGNVSEVAFQVGFSTLSYFSKCFRQKFGHSPYEYVKLHSVHFLPLRVA